MQFAVTEISGYLRCGRQWDLSSYNRQSYGKLIPKPALALGKMIHQAHAEWLEEYADIGDGAQPLADRYVVILAHELDNVRQQYRKRIGTDPSEDEMDMYRDSATLGTRMCKNYQEFWKTPLPEGFSLIATEQQAVVDIPCTQHQLTGRLDAIIADDQGRLYVLEHKTFSRHPNDTVLAMTYQFLAYTWMCHKLFPTNRTLGVAYDGMWKRPEPPKGRAFEDLFYRKIIQRPQAEIDELPVYLADIVDMMADYPLIVPNRRWEGCGDCDFEKLCAAMSRGDDYQFALETAFVKLDADKNMARDDDND